MPCVPVFYHTHLEQNMFFLALFQPKILQFFTILRDKLRSFNIQDDGSTRGYIWRGDLTEGYEFGGFIF